MTNSSSVQQLEERACCTGGMWKYWYCHFYDETSCSPLLRSCTTSDTDHCRLETAHKGCSCAHTQMGLFQTHINVYICICVYIYMHYINIYPVCIYKYCVYISMYVQYLRCHDEEIIFSGPNVMADVQYTYI